MKAVNCDTKEVTYYNSMYAVQQHLGINAGIVKMICEKINNCKTGISKKDGCNYKFEYVEKNDLLDNYKKSVNKRPRLSDEDKKLHQKEAMKKWQNKEYTCPKCSTIMKNASKYIHNKTHI